jgi:hypothetical protein
VCALHVECLMCTPVCSFKGDYADRKSVPNQTIHHAIVFSIPLSSILCIQPAAATFAADKTLAPTLTPIADMKSLRELGEGGGGGGWGA